MRSVESRIWKISTYGLTRGMVHRHPPQRLRFGGYIAEVNPRGAHAGAQFQDAVLCFAKRKRYSPQ